VLVEAALQLAETGGAEAVSVREAARRAGVSPGAPFRHFPNRDALMAAVADEPQRVSGPRSTPHWPKRLRATRWRGFGPLGSLICAGRCVPGPFRDHLERPVFRSR
jgi:hypothetical protein